MFRLIKLAVMGLLGYAIYEFIRGMLGAEISQAISQGTGRRAEDQQPHVGSGKMQFSGPGQGQRVETEEPSGTAARHFVGRGVVHR